MQSLLCLLTGLIVLLGRPSCVESHKGLTNEIKLALIEGQLTKETNNSLAEDKVQRRMGRTNCTVQSLGFRYFSGPLGECMYS